MDKTAKIRQLNDAFRTSFKGGKVMLTLGIRSKADEEQTEILERVLNFNDFNKGNDPYQEHDFGKFEHKGEKIFWKIDYYAPDMNYASEDPSDPAKTIRVLTVMLADEY